MEETKNKNASKEEQLELLERLKKEKINKIFNIKEEEEIKEIKEEPEEEVKKENFILKYISLKKILITLGIIVLILNIWTIYFLLNKYNDYKLYLHENKEIIAFGEKYKQEKEREKRELKDLKNISISNINDLPNNKKEILLNIIPSGSPITKEVVITSPYGKRVHPVSGQTKEHHGVDLRLNIGDPIIAPAMGKVSFAGVQNGYGNVVKVDHFYGFQTVYAHLNKILVKEGDIVGKGKIIAEGGNTGVSTGPHLHYEVKYNGETLDPENFMNWDKEKFNILFEKEGRIKWENYLTIIGKN